MMMKNNKIFLAIFILVGFLSFSSCKDGIVSEITTLNVSRAFSPTDLTAIVVNRTGVRLNWTVKSDIKSYSIELFENDSTQAFVGTPVVVVDSIKANQIPYTITGLDGATNYSARVKAIGDGVDESKYTGVSFKTAEEQIFLPVDPAKLTATSVTLNWPAGQSATSIVLNPGNITHTVTSAEIAAGEAVITGLTSETAYTAVMYKNTKIRGTVTFTTAIDLNGAIAVYPTDDLAALISNASGGETFAVFPGTYNINADVIVSKSITIQGFRPSDKPIINGLVLRIKSTVGSLSVKNLILDASGYSSLNQTFIYDDDSTTPYGDLTVENSEIKNYSKGIHYVSKKALINNTVFRGNLIHDIDCNGGDFIDYRSGLSKNFLFENNTCYNVASSTSTGARDLFRMDAGGSSNFPGITSVITIQNNTFYNASNSASTSYRKFLYVRLANNEIHLNKNLIVHTNAYFTNSTATNVVEAVSNNYFDTINLPSYSSSKFNDSGNFKTYDPMFSDVSSGNFTVGNLDLKAAGIGDPRWLQ